MQSLDGQISAAVTELFFNGPYSTPITMTLSITNHSLKDGILHIYAGQDNRSLGNNFNVNSKALAKTSFGVTMYMDVGGTNDIRLTLKPILNLDMTANLPGSINVCVRYSDDSASDELRVPVRYHFSSSAKTKVPTRSSSLPADCLWNPDGKCGQCKKRLGMGGYMCMRCSPAYSLCLECAERNAREAHYARYGSGHEMDFTTERFECSVCLNMPTSSFVVCEQCEKEVPEMAVICGDCVSNHSNLRHHVSKRLGDHDMREIDRHPLPFREPEPLPYERGKLIHCSACRTKIRGDLFRCTRCINPYILCDRCADDGGIAEHFLHKFQYLLPTIVIPKKKSMNGTQLRAQENRI